MGKRPFTVYVLRELKRHPHHCAVDGLNLAALVSVDSTEFLVVMRSR